MKLLLVDGHYYIYRSFYAIRHLTNSKGKPTNAVYGVVKTLQRMLQDIQPDRAAVVFDSGPPEARLELQETYKANRPEAPDELTSQFPDVERVIDALGFPRITTYGEEADDIIACYVKEAMRQNMDVVLATNDKDLMQLVNGHCVIYQTNKDGFQLLHAGDVENKWGVPPEKIRDVLALTGDSVDNIQGVPGVGPKTAAGLIQKFGTVENLLARLDDVSSEKTRKALQEYRDRIEANIPMVTLRDQLALPASIEDLKIQPNIEAQVATFEELEFKTFLAAARKQIAQSSASVQGELF